MQLVRSTPPSHAAPALARATLRRLWLCRHKETKERIASWRDAFEIVCAVGYLFCVVLHALSCYTPCRAASQFHLRILPPSSSACIATCMSNHPATPYAIATL